MLQSLQLASQMCCLVFQTETTSASQQELKAEKEGESSNVEKMDSPM